MPFDWEKSLLTRRALLGQFAALGSGVHAGFTKEPDFPVRFENVGVAAGLTVPTVYGGRTENLFILETTGCGAAFFDYDQDGWLDIFLVNGTVLNPKGSEPSNRLLKNNRDG